MHIDISENEEIEQILSNIKQFIHLKNIKETINAIDKILNTHFNKEVIFSNNFSKNSSNFYCFIQTNF